MAYANQSQQQQYGDSANLQFYSSNYDAPINAPAGGRFSTSRSGMGGVTPQYSSAFGGSSTGAAGAGGAADGMSAAASGERLSRGLLAAFGTGGYSDEPPLLEELGINFGHIKSKTLTVLNPLARVDQNIMDDSDLAGPILFFLLFGTFLLLSGKIHFGYIYGVALLGSISLHFIMNLMATTGGIDFIRTASVLGYCLLPLVVTSAIGIIVSVDNFIGYLFCALSIFWCTYSSSAMFVAVLQLSDMRPLVAYPLMLFYSVFAVMTIFADKA
ncbi:golgi membrane protein-like protein [Myxozyma melibiosi]|uniref:Protein YIP n=1 Tax=Myxozyma melibiosi TaxID=54550 RepID=A0ABR1F2W9_9ASCO